jgi:hypothetical protein
MPVMLLLILLSILLAQLLLHAAGVLGSGHQVQSVQQKS